MQDRAELSGESVRELLELALDAGAMAVWQWDLRTGSLLQLASRALDFGHPPGTVPATAQAWLEQVHPLDRDESLRRVGLCLAGQSATFEMVLRVHDSSGNYRWVRVEGRVADRDERQEPVRFIGVSQDVHRLRTIEETVRRNAELFGRIPDSIVCTDLDGVITYWNQGATELYGWQAEELLGRHITERFPESARSEIALVHARLNDGDEFSTEFEDYRKDGSRVWVEARIARYGAPDAPSGIMGFARDVSKRRAAQELLQRDASILSQLQDIVACVDVNRRVTYWNDAAERVLGWRREEILGRLVSERLPSAIADQINANMDEALAGNPAPPGEWEDYRKDGSRVWIAWRSETLRDSDGNPIGITSVGRDITEQRRVEAERKELETRLSHAQKMESLGTMAGGIAHDFNNTLAVVLVYAELGLSHPGLDAELRESLEQIRRAGGRARDLVARILTFSRMQELERSVVDLGALLVDYEKLARATLPATVELKVTLGECAMALADGNQVHQVLLNLCANAAQAMDDRGRLTIELSQRWSDEQSLASGALSPGHYALIEVTDTGSGMSADTQARMFEPFFTTKPVGQGTGLGLATAVAIIKNHGGGIDVESSLGSGSRFRIYLPVSHDASLASRNVPSLPPSGRGQRILLVDDEDAVAIMTRSALQSLGYYVECVFSPEAFLERFLQAPARWDLLITDQTMPHITGIELSRRLRSLGCRLPILIATGFSRQVTPEALRAAGCSLLRKPFDVDELAGAVGSALGNPASLAWSEGP